MVAILTVSLLSLLNHIVQLLSNADVTYESRVIILDMGLGSCNFTKLHWISWGTYVQFWLMS